MKNNKSISLIICFLLVFTLIGCSGKNIEESSKTQNTQSEISGVFEGKSFGHNGEILLSLELDSGYIKEITLLEHKESEGISDLAIERIPQEIINEQSIKVDNVSGATITSRGIINAVTDALKNANVVIEKYKLEKVAETIQVTNKELDTDVVVIGGGGAGLAAAVSAHQNGAKVVLIEKMPRLGGNTILSGGAYNAVDPSRQEKQGIEDSIEKHFNQTYEGGDKKGNPELIQTLVEGAYPAIEWLESLNMKFDDKVFTVLGGLWPRAHKPSSAVGTGFINTYKNYIDNNDNIDIIFDTEVTEITEIEGKVNGVIAQSRDTNYKINASKGVIIATGGFANNSQLRDKYNTQWPSLTKLKSTNHPGATGDGLILAEDVGANLINLEDIQLLPMGDPATGSLSGNVEQGVENRIFINNDGNRFVDEGERRDVMTKALMEQEDSSMWVIVDTHSYPTEDTRNNFNESIEELMAQGRAFKGETIEELAEQIKVNPKNLKKSIEEFNAAVENKAEDPFGRTLFENKLDKGPFYAGKRVPTVHHTMGGIEINSKAEVIGKDGKIIKNLYAAGEVTGGIHGSNRLGGNALADITVFGKIAGKNASSNN